jgi:hypothetical protein
MIHFDPQPFITHTAAATYNTAPRRHRETVRSPPDDGGWWVAGILVAILLMVLLGLLLRPAPQRRPLVLIFT